MKKILVFKNGKLVKICKNLKEACRFTHTHHETVRLLIKNGQKTLKGYSFDEEI